MSKLSKIAAVTALVLGGIALQSVSASAMPGDPTPATIAHSENVSGVQTTAWRRHWHHRRWHRWHRRY